MTEFRYHRMTGNDNSWCRPHSGRLGKSQDYVGENGFGHEDWNFAKDVWNDGKYHLYLKSAPAKSDLNLIFNLVLGMRTDLGHMVVGFAENVSYNTSTLDEHIWRRRAKELDRIDQEGGLDGYLKGLSVKEKTREIKREGEEVYNVALSPSDLIVLEEPFFIPNDIYEVRSNRYLLLKMTADQYAGIKKRAPIGTTLPPDEGDTFPEGKLVERLHKSRERNQKLVAKAKKRFIKKNGLLYCEICKWEPAEHFGRPDLKNFIIEAHHDVPLSSEEYNGQTNTKDLRMLCPNCHRAIHKIRPWTRVDEFKPSR